ncbi:hypothetical protein [Absidia glauca]|uniref:BHLH domain-containing protein n=1 Tax=Absidia glauca TaxID=4829 RepID=A0A168NKW3_ABSGL|nr:hypothetical protein [Absidia glauca]
MTSFTSFSTTLPTTSTSVPASYYANVSASAASSTTTTSQQLLGLQFAPQVPTTDDQQLHRILQQQQAFLLQQTPPLVMYDHRRDSIPSLGATNRSIRTQSKAEKRAEHNATERARREGLNTRFQQLAHLLPNLQHDTRPSKGTIIERTLEFVRDAIQKEERYRHEIKDLRHTNRQLLKQLTHLTTVHNARGNNALDSDDQRSVPASPHLDAASSPETGLSSPPAIQHRQKQIETQQLHYNDDANSQHLSLMMQQPAHHNTQNSQPSSITTRRMKSPASQHRTSMQQTSSSASFSSLSSASSSSSELWRQLPVTTSSWFQLPDAPVVTFAPPGQATVSQQHTFPPDLQDMKPVHGTLGKDYPPDLFASYPLDPTRR